MEYRILGPLEVLDRGESIGIGSRQQRALLAILILHANRVVSTDRLLEDLWPDDAIGKERTLWVYISRLRAILEPEREAHGDNTVLVTRDHGYCLVVDGDQVDASRFEHLVEQARLELRRDPAAASEIFRCALGLWRGGALEDFEFDEFARLHVDRLEDLRLTALEDRLEADLRCGRHRDVIGELEELAGLHPLRERFVSCQMVALYRAGRQADALRRFERYRRFLADELGIEPSPELRRTEERILLHDPSLSPSSAGGDDRPMVTGNPFQGLHAFGEQDAHRFFGRERLVAEVLRKIGAGQRLVALVGSSGSGKSSAIHAGVVPAIRKDAVEATGGWLIATMVPGARPFDEAEAALLRSTPDAPGTLAELLDDPEDGLLRSCRRILPTDDARLLLVIDQFEELFTLGAPVGVIDRFVTNLEMLAADPYGRVVVVVALRADFYGRPLRYPAFAQLVADGIVNVVPLTLDELESAAERPAALARTRLEPALVVQLLQDVVGQSGGLPLFQYTLTELFDRRHDDMLTLADYETLGGVTGAIAKRAEDVFLGLGDAERDAAKQLFLRLVTIADQGWARRRLTGAEVATFTSDHVAVHSVVEGFASHRLLTYDRDPIDGGPTIEVAHEALLQEWPRLRRWIEDGRRDVETRVRLASAVAEWEASGRREGYLLDGPRLDDYEGWATRTDLLLSADEHHFLDESIRRHAAVAEAEQRRVEREIRLDRAARRRLWSLGGVSVVVGLVAMVVILPLGGGQPAIAVVHGVPGDLGIADLMIEGVGVVEREHDITIDLVQPLVSAEDDLRRLADAGTDLIVVGREFDLALESVAPDYPGVTWVAIDPAAVHIEGPNIVEIHFAVEESAFVAGAAAALTTTTGRVGFVGGYQTFRTERSRNGFEQGVAWIDPDVDVVSTFVGPVVDPVAAAELADDDAEQIALEMYGDGVDVIYHDAGSAGRGVVRAASTWSGGAAHVWTIGSDADEFLTLPVELRDVVLTSTIKRFDTATDSVIDAFLAGELPSGEVVVGFDVGAVEVSRTGGFLDAVDGSLANLEGELEFGHVAVSRHAEHPAGWQLPGDVRVSLTLSDDGCHVDAIEGGDWLDDERVLAVPRASVVEFEMHNASSDIGGLALRTVPVGTAIDELWPATDDGEGPPAQFDAILGISTTQLGGSTGSSALVDSSPFVANCILGRPDRTAIDHVALIVRPT